MPLPGRRTTRDKPGVTLSFEGLCFTLCGTRALARLGVPIGHTANL
jgi:hypothetical protein